MPAEIDGDRAMYAKMPAWHRIGKVKADGFFTSEEALAQLNPNKEPVRKVTAGAMVDGVFVASEDTQAIYRVNPDTDAPQILSFMSRDYSVIQLEDQFAFLDNVVGSIGGAHYEAAVSLRKGRQVALTIDTGAVELDPGERGDVLKKFIWGFNSYDGSWAFRVKTGNFRVECANMAAMALRGSGEESMSGDWTTKHTSNVMDRVAAAQRTLGIWKEYNDLFFEQAEDMIHVELTDGRFERIINDLFEVDGEKNVDAINNVRAIYELSPTQMKLNGTFWGGFNAVTEYNDWRTAVRGGKVTSANDMRFLRQIDDNTGLKQRAWDRFREELDDARKVKVAV